VCSYNIYASEPGDFALEHSTDFVNWATVATESVTNIYPQAFEVAAEPGFFRLKRLMTSEAR